jgi:hypothetical protein
MYCQGVEELLKNINEKSGKAKNKEPLGDEHYDFAEDFEGSYSMEYSDRKG